jgi:hypothetical protein
MKPQNLPHTCHELFLLCEKKDIFGGVLCPMFRPPLFFFITILKILVAKYGEKVQIGLYVC